MGGIFADARIVPAVVEVQVLAIQFQAPCRYCRGGRPATTNIRPVDAIGSPMIADLYVCTSHAGQLVERARAKNLKVSVWPPAD